MSFDFSLLIVAGRQTPTFDFRGLGGPPGKATWGGSATVIARRVVEPMTCRSRRYPRSATWLFHRDEKRVAHSLPVQDREIATVSLLSRQGHTVGTHPARRFPS